MYNNAIRRSRTKRLTDEKGRTRSFGIQQAQNVWGRKMRCRCGSPMLRHRWRTNNAGKPIYGYECKRHHDTPASAFRMNKAIQHLSVRSSRLDKASWN